MLRTSTIIIGLCLSILFVSCGGAPAGSSPESLSNAYIAALKAKDETKVLALSSAKFNERMKKYKAESPEKAAENFDFMCTNVLKHLEGTSAGSTSIDGDTAEIAHTQGYITVTMKMIKENDQWVMNKCSISDKTPLEEQGQ